jgi:hypothetical protein
MKATLLASSRMRGQVSIGQNQERSTAHLVEGFKALTRAAPSERSLEYNKPVREPLQYLIELGLAKNDGHFPTHRLQWPHPHMLKTQHLIHMFFLKLFQVSPRLPDFSTNIYEHSKAAP